MEQSEAGLVAATGGWFAVNIRDAPWATSESFGDACIFEGDAAPFAQIGYTLAVLQPGQPNGLYHREEAGRPASELGRAALGAALDELNRRYAGDGSEW